MIMPRWTRRRLQRNFFKNNSKQAFLNDFHFTQTEKFFKTKNENLEGNCKWKINVYLTISLIVSCFRQT